MPYYLIHNLYQKTYFSKTEVMLIQIQTEFH